MRNQVKYKSIWFCNSWKGFYIPPGTLSSALNCIPILTSVYWKKVKYLHIFHDHEWNKSLNGDVRVLTTATTVNASHPNSVLFISCLSLNIFVSSLVFILWCQFDKSIYVSNALSLLAQLFIQKGITFVFQELCWLIKTDGKEPPIQVFTLQSWHLAQ